MNRLCERPGCSAPAEVAYGFDAEALIVWIDALVEVQGLRFGVLCRRHADAMIVPLGWMLDDRREPTLRLFKAPATDVLPPRPRRERQSRDDTGEQLRLDSALLDRVAPPGDAAALEPAAADAAAVEPAAADAAAVEPVAGDGAPVEDVPVEDVPAPAPVGETQGAAEVGTTGPAVDTEPAWVPVFDPADDLHGLLKARGRLLSRAFNGAPTDG